MKSFMVSSVLIGFTSTLFAGPSREVVVCENDHYNLVIRETAVVTLKTGTLSFSGRSITLKCQMELVEKSDLVNYTCLEDRAGDGRYLAGVLLEKGNGTANVAHEQIYPLKPKTLAELPCRTEQE